MESKKKNSSRRELYSETGPQETRKISNKQPNLPPKGIRKRRKQSQSQMDENNKDQTENK